MRPLVAVQFEVRPAPGEPAPSVYPRLRAMVSQWITASYRRWHKVEVPTLLEDGTSTPIQDHRISVASAMVDASQEQFTVEWSYPHGPHGDAPHLRWGTRIEVVRVDSSTEFSCVVRLGATDFTVAPFEYKVAPPRIVGEILFRFPCMLNGRRVPAAPQQVTAIDINAFVAEHLISANRRLPLVLLSPDSYSGRPLANPERVATALLGMAEVFSLSDRWAGFALTNAIGKSNSCYNGAVRVYWPGFDPAKPSGIEFPMMADKVRVMEAGDGLGLALFRRIAPITVFGYAPGRLSRRIEDGLAKVRHNEVVALRAKAAEKIRGLDLEQFFDELARENDALRVEKADLARQLEERDQELATAKANMVAISAATRGAPPEEAAAPADDAGEYATVLDAVTAAREDFKETITFTDKAVSSAEDSPFSRPREVYEALDAIDDVCKLRRSALQRREGMGGLEAAFKERGFLYKAHESMTSTGKWGIEYEMLYKGRKVSIEEHLALGKGGPEACLRIHFYFDDDARRFVVDHCGRHKTNTRT